MQVRGEDLHAGRSAPAPGLLQHQHRDGVGLFARGAANRPHTYSIGGRLALEDLGDDVGLEPLKDLGIAEEAGDRNKQIICQGTCFLRLVAQQVQVLCRVLDVIQLHAPGDAPQDSRSLVAAEVTAGARLQDGQDLGKDQALGLIRLRRVFACNHLAAGAAQPHQG